MGTGDCSRSGGCVDIVLGVSDRNANILTDELDLARLMSVRKCCEIWPYQTIINID